MLKLNLGSGYDVADGWEHVDKLDYGDNIVANVLDGLTNPDEHFDFVLMNHTLQMFHYDELPVVLAEVKRVMKPGATLRILTPDLVLAFNAVVEKNYSYFPIADELEPTLAGKFTRYIFWHGDTRCAFDESALKNLLERNGFKDIRRAEFGECELDSREHESLIVECVK